MASSHTRTALLALPAPLAPFSPPPGFIFVQPASPLNAPPPPARPPPSKSLSALASPDYLRPTIRKKSGEFVRPSLKSPAALPLPDSCLALRPCSRPSSPDGLVSVPSTSTSAPSTPSAAAKVVHFDSHLEHVRHFLAQQRPIAVSRDGSPVETETEGEDEFPFPIMSIRLVNHPDPSFPQSRAASGLIELPAPASSSGMVYLKSLQLVKSGREIRGEVVVRNVSFEKLVAARFTFDDWRTVSEVTGDYSGKLSESLDEFVFEVRVQDGKSLGALRRKQMWLAIRYSAMGQEWWDNNQTSNYLISIGRRPESSPSDDSAGSSAPTGPSQHRRLGSIDSLINPYGAARSRTVNSPGGSSSGSSQRMALLRAKLDQLVRDDTPPVPTTKKSCSTPAAPSSPLNALSASCHLKANGKGLSARYDFGLSLKQAQLFPRNMDHKVFAESNWSPSARHCPGSRSLPLAPDKDSPPTTAPATLDQGQADLTCGMAKLSTCAVPERREEQSRQTACRSGHVGPRPSPVKGQTGHEEDVFDGGGRSCRGTFSSASRFSPVPDMGQQHQVDGHIGGLFGFKHGSGPQASGLMFDRHGFDRSGGLASFY